LTVEESDALLGKAMGKAMEALMVYLLEPQLVVVMLEKQLMVVMWVLLMAFSMAFESVLLSAI
jgi:hypothetical protein